MSDSPLSPQEIRAAAAAHQELGPEYSDAVVASFLGRVEEEIAARVDAHLAGTRQPPAPLVTPDSRGSKHSPQLTVGDIGTDLTGVLRGDRLGGG
jgi:hypothetical protein